MTSVLLIYPFFLTRRDRSVFRFPPLGISYLAASLRQAGHDVHVLDCTFLDRTEALQKALAVGAEVVGIYCMVSMTDECQWFAQQLRPHCRLLIAGGPLPTCDPEPFLDSFDVVVCGEGEQTMLELLRQHADGLGPAGIAGTVYRLAASDASVDGKGAVVHAPARTFAKRLDEIPFPARDLLPNADYIRYGRKKHGYSITTVMSTRGCPFRCEFCSNVVFGGSYRERSPENVVDEVEAALGLGYDRMSFADDVFTMKRERVVAVCREIRRRGLRFHWECLGRVDALDEATAREMQEAGCTRIFFGIESGSDSILELMQKRITTGQARRAVQAAHAAGLQVGAFFILCYPGDTDDTVLKTLRFATDLPLDYVGLSMPYPLPGTDLYKRTRDRITRDWHPDDSPFGGHVLIVDAGFSQAKTWFAILKGHAQFEIKRRAGPWTPILLAPFEKATDLVFRMLR
jgi:anaerobic magnesium-protoporphyrin IX monomethyl ester cyclase